MLAYLIIILLFPALQNICERYDPYQKLECKRARIIMEQVFADPVIRKNVGAAKQLGDISQPNKPPDGVLVLLKQAKNHLQKHQDDYVKIANKEIARMQRIKENQNKLAGYFGILMLGIIDFTSAWFNNK